MLRESVAFVKCPHKLPQITQNSTVDFCSFVTAKRTRTGGLHTKQCQERNINHRHTDAYASCQLFTNTSTCPCHSIVLLLQTLAFHGLNNSISASFRSVPSSINAFDQLSAQKLKIRRPTSLPALNYYHMAIGQVNGQDIAAAEFLGHVLLPRIPCHVSKSLILEQHVQRFKHHLLIRALKQ
jgi:hypothetical protein